MRIAVVGAGAMGGLFGGSLAETGQDVRLIDLPGPHLQAMATEGLLLETDRGTRRIHVQACIAAEASGASDLVLVFTKGPHTEAAMHAAAHLVGPDTRVLTVQNGLGNAERIAAALPQARLLIGMTSWPADLAAPGRVVSHGHGEVRIWTLDGAPDDMLAEIASAFTDAGLNCVADPLVQVAIWEKVAFNAAMNSVSAVTRLSVGPIGDCPEGRALVGQVVDEALAVARASGHAVDGDRVHATVARAFAGHRDHKASMLQDVLAHRRTEIEQINGAIVAAGTSLGIDTPATRILRDLVRIVDAASG